MDVPIKLASTTRAIGVAGRRGSVMDSSPGSFCRPLRPPLAGVAEAGASTAAAASGVGDGVAVAPRGPFRRAPRHHAPKRNVRHRPEQPGPRLTWASFVVQLNNIESTVKPPSVI